MPLFLATHGASVAEIGLVAGVASDALGYSGAIALVAALTAGSGLWVLVDMPARPHVNHEASPDIDDIGKKLPA